MIGTVYICPLSIAGHLRNGRLFYSVSRNLFCRSKNLSIASNVHSFRAFSSSLNRTTTTNTNTIKSLLTSSNCKLIKERNLGLLYFSTNANRENILQTNKPNADPVKRKSVWKSTPRKVVTPVSSDGDDSLESGRLRKFDLEDDFSYIEDEVPLYEYSNPTTFKMIFVMVVAQYIFWTYCANVLYMFYAGVDEHGNKLRNLTESKKVEQGKKASFLKTWREYLIANGYQTFVQAMFFLVGNMIAVGMMFMLRRFITFIRLMPGGRHIKIGRLNVFGWPSAKHVSLYRLDDVYSIQHRSQRIPYMSIRVRDIKYNLFLDSSGKFPNAELFDKTIGVMKNFGRYSRL